jgi:glycine/D-amino acid oxidase-like deaminating enzyme
MEPIVVADADPPGWDREADPVVVGFGGAGAATALRAREQGADILLVDRFGGRAPAGPPPSAARPSRKTMAACP